MKRVAVVYGGWSSEREVSLSSGEQMLRAAKAAGMACLGTKSTYTGGDAFKAADRIVDELASAGVTLAEMKKLLK